MLYSSNETIHGIPEGVSYGQNERVDELNTRISSRYFSDVPLPPQFDPRPIPTKYSFFPVIDRRTESITPIHPMVNHSVEMNFNPATRNAPPFCYFVNVDVETGPRNQTVAAQHGAGQGLYIPSSQSDLYKVKVDYQPSNQPFPTLFEKQTFLQGRPALLKQNNIGNESFFNHTRSQIRSVDQKGSI
jgi:hypothetical protein